ncbi:hypothetical protein ATE84_4268 [Aquimarina sp. MAR_2010_214]|uniref:hypothetical protein n=1 Tax=Aquimarina sp. MAR_2010_214 TaxID=1250026 RepID=UPI000C707E85|nr:hypothetical protein [Aquimarina sp. MAR_2010_214]PKV52166.1 hypothetical protein ATE84_4268 [Aquimarina sp. MAR_2010_214]
MKKSKFIFSILSIAFILTSCETEDQEQLPEQSFETTEIEPSENTNGKASTFRYENVYRYYSGRGSLHTYKTQGGLGVGIGRREGVAFRTPVVKNPREINKALYSDMYFMLHPSKTDFVLTTNTTEFLNLVNRGWRDAVRGQFVLIQKKPGNGKRKLYRFYDARNSDHLFTKNYSEGINAGLKYEGVVGWVY